MSIGTARTFTGWHMTAILVTFFGVVMAVNFTMARMAISTFGGTVVDNSYVASQNYNSWLNAAERQDRLGWQVVTRLDGDRHIMLSVQSNGAALDGVSATGDALHPLGREEDQPLSFVAIGEGALRSKEALPQGRWNVQLALRKNADIFHLREPLQ